MDQGPNFVSYEPYPPLLPWAHLHNSAVSNTANTHQKLEFKLSFPWLPRKIICTNHHHILVERFSGMAKLLSLYVCARVCVCVRVHALCVSYLAIGKPRDVTRQVGPPPCM